jgi:hypothetical protein
MRVPEPPYPSFTQVMVIAYPALVQVFAPPRSRDGARFDSDAWSFESYEEERRSFDNVFMVSKRVFSLFEAHRSRAFALARG